MKRAIFLTPLLFAALAAPNALADQVRYMNHGAQAFSAFTSMIDGARKSIDLVTFIFEPCNASSQVILESLARASRRGVRVRLIIDGIVHSSKEQDQFINAFARQGAEARYYNIPKNLAALGVNLRLHEKLMVVDRESYIVGGRNISDEYFGMSANQNWIDSDVAVSGPSAAQAEASFQNIWDGELTSTKAAQPENAKTWAQYCGSNIAPDQVSRARSFAASMAGQVLEAVPLRTCANMEFVSDQSDFGNPKYSDYGDANDSRQPDEYMSPLRLLRKGTARGMLDFVNGARSRLDVTNYFYGPVGKERDAFANARDRHVAVDVVTNQEMDDGPGIYRQAQEYVIQTAAARDSIGTERISLISSQGSLKDPNVLSLPGAHFLIHSKVMVRDGKDALVGSYNLDSRSYNSNLEAYVIAHDCPALAADIAAQGRWIRSVRDSDQASGQIPAPPEPSLAAKLFADLNMILF